MGIPLVAFVIVFGWTAELLPARHQLRERSPMHS
jgi:hypothetical protein